MQAQGFRAPDEITADPYPQSETEGSPLDIQQSGIAQRCVVCGTQDGPCCSNTRGLNFPRGTCPGRAPVLSGCQIAIPQHHTCPLPPPGYRLSLPPKFSFHFLLLESCLFLKAQLKLHFVPELLGIPHLQEGVTGGEKKPQFSS